MPKQIECVDCGNEFEVSDGEIEFYNNKGFTLPKRCKPCREKKKRDRKYND